ncbi:MAG TPA: hypothetical protein VII72_15675 [Myxococcota bacterium]|jgi:hypothetical protein
MNAWARFLLGFAALLALSGSTCTSNFSEEDLVAEERKQADAARAEEKYDDEVGEQGGENEAAIREQIDATDGGSGADF